MMADERQLLEFILPGGEGVMAVTQPRQVIWERMADPEYRHALVESFISERLAIQIRHLRESNDWTQAQLAERMGKQQAAISLWEDAEYGRYTLATLKELARAFDVALILHFAPFSELASRMSELSQRDLSPISYEEERVQVTWVEGIDNLKAVPVPPDTCQCGVKMIEHKRFSDHPPRGQPT